MRRDDSRWIGCCRRSLQELRYSADWSRLDMTPFVVGIGAMPVEILVGCNRARERERTALRQYWFLHHVDFRRENQDALFFFSSSDFISCGPNRFLIACPANTTYLKMVSVLGEVVLIVRRRSMCLCQFEQRSRRWCRPVTVLIGGLRTRLAGRRRARPTHAVHVRLERWQRREPAGQRQVHASVRSIERGHVLDGQRQGPPCRVDQGGVLSRAEFTTHLLESSGRMGRGANNTCLSLVASCLFAK